MTLHLNGSLCKSLLSNILYHIPICVFERQILWYTLKKERRSSMSMTFFQLRASLTHSLTHSEKYDFYICVSKFNSILYRPYDVSLWKNVLAQRITFVSHRFMEIHRFKVDYFDLFECMEHPHLHIYLCIRTLL